MQRIKSRCDNTMMVALRVVFRAGWALPNPVNRVNTNEDTRYPFAVLKPSSLTKIESAAYSVTQPVKSATPQSTHSAGTGYTAAITWSPEAETFAASTVYTAKVVLTAANGYAFSNDFGAADVTGLPATAGDSAIASKVTVTRDSATQVIIEVKYVATAA